MEEYPNDDPFTVVREQWITLEVWEEEKRLNQERYEIIDSDNGEIPPLRRLNERQWLADYLSGIYGEFRLFRRKNPALSNFSSSIVLLRGMTRIHPSHNLGLRRSPRGDLPLCDVCDAQLAISYYCNVCDLDFCVRCILKSATLE